MKKIPILLFIFLNLYFYLYADIPGKSYTVSGHIKDASTGEELIGANIFVKKLNTGTVTNQYGFYSLTLAEGTYEISFSYVGYLPVVKEVKIDGDLVLNLEL